MNKNLLSILFSLFFIQSINTMESDFFLDSLFDNNAIDKLFDFDLDQIFFSESDDSISSESSIENETNEFGGIAKNFSCPLLQSSPPFLYGLTFAIDNQDLVKEQLVESDSQKKGQSCITRKKRANKFTLDKETGFCCCLRCNELFSRRTILSHIAYEEDKLPYQCQLCKLAFNLGHYNLHEILHHQNKNPQLPKIISPAKHQSWDFLDETSAQGVAQDSKAIELVRFVDQSNSFGPAVVPHQATTNTVLKNQSWNFLNESFVNEKKNSNKEKKLKRKRIPSKKKQGNKRVKNTLEKPAKKNNKLEINQKYLLYEKMFKCKDCAVVFDKESYSEHIKKDYHSVTRNCPFCDYSSNQIANFVRHIKTPHYLYYCKECQKECGSEGALKQHYVNEHPQNETCEKCGYKGIAATMRRHLRGEHTINICTYKHEKSEECKKTYNSYGAFMQHLDEYKK